MAENAAMDVYDELMMTTNGERKVQAGAVPTLDDHISWGSIRSVYRLQAETHCQGLALSQYYLVY